MFASNFYRLHQIHTYLKFPKSYQYIAEKNQSANMGTTTMQMYSTIACFPVLLFEGSPHQIENDISAISELFFSPPPPHKTACPNGAINKSEIANDP